VPNEESFAWKFDRFRATRVIKHNTGAFLRGFDGTVAVTLPLSYTSPEGCRNGKFRLQTPQLIEETSAGSLEFTSGLLSLNGTGEIQFSPEDPRVTIRALGAQEETYGLDGLIAIGNCYL
jgi:hypothetical protein